MEKFFVVLFLCIHFCLSGQSGNGLVAYYPFCNSLSDMSQHGHDGVFNGPVICVSDRFGSPLSAYRFPGIYGVYARIEFSPDFLIQPDSALSISAWYKNIPDETVHGIKGIITKHNPYNQAHIYDYHFGLYDLDKATFGARYNMVWTQEDDQDSLWYHVVGVYTDSTWSIYQNGHLEDIQSTKEFGTLQSTNQIYIGNNFNGILDDIYIFRKALTPSEIDSLYHLPSSCITDHIEACEEYQTEDGLTISSDTIILDTIDSSAGTDSLLYIEIIIHENESDTVEIDTCGSYQTELHVYNLSGEYEEIYTSSTGCDSTIFIRLVLQRIEAEIQENNGVLIATGGSGYQWLDCANGFQQIEGATDSIFIPLSDGLYAVEITRECIDTSVCLDVIISGTYPLKSYGHNFKFSPNPISNSISIHSEQPVNIEFLRIVNFQGYQVMIIDHIGTNEVIPIKLLPGIYALIIGTGNNMQEVYKIIIQ